MTKFARVKDGRLIDVWRVPEDYPDTAARDRALGASGWIEVSGDKVPGAVDNGDGTFTNPATTQDVRPRSWDAYDFKLRFTPAEHMAILTAAKSEVSVERFLDLLNTAAATGTRLQADDPVLNAGLQTMEAAGLIGQGRAAEIVA